MLAEDVDLEVEAEEDERLLSLVVVLEINRKKLSFQKKSLPKKQLKNTRRQ